MNRIPFAALLTGLAWIVMTHLHLSGQLSFELGLSPLEPSLPGLLLSSLVSTNYFSMVVNTGFLLFFGYFVERRFGFLWTAALIVAAWLVGYVLYLGLNLTSPTQMIGGGCVVMALAGLFAVIRPVLKQVAIACGTLALLMVLAQEKEGFSNGGAFVSMLLFNLSALSGFFLRQHEPLPVEKKPKSDESMLPNPLDLLRRKKAAPQGVAASEDTSAVVMIGNERTSETQDTSMFTPRPSLVRAKPISAIDMRHTTTGNLQKMDTGEQWKAAEMAAIEDTKGKFFQNLTPAQTEFRDEDDTPGGPLTGQQVVEGQKPVAATMKLEDIMAGLSDNPNDVLVREELIAAFIERKDYQKAKDQARELITLLCGLSRYVKAFSVFQVVGREAGGMTLGRGSAVEMATAMFSVKAWDQAGEVLKNIIKSDPMFGQIPDYMAKLILGYQQMETGQKLAEYWRRRLFEGFQNHPITLKLREAMGGDVLSDGTTVVDRVQELMDSHQYLEAIRLLRKNEKQVEQFAPAKLIAIGQKAGPSADLAALWELGIRKHQSDVTVPMLVLELAMLYYHKLGNKERGVQWKDFLMQNFPRSTEANNAREMIR